MEGPAHTAGHDATASGAALLSAVSPDASAGTLAALVDDQVDRILPFLFALGMGVTLASIAIDVLIVPAFILTAAGLKTGLVMTQQALGLALPRRMRRARKALLGSSLIAFGMVTATIAGWAPAPHNVFHMLGTVLVLGIATPILPLSPRESAVFVGMYLACSLAVLWFSADNAQLFTAMAIVFLIVGIAAWMLARRMWTLQTDNIELAEARWRRVEELAHANRQLEQLASHDPLTGLANRRHCSETFGKRYGPGTDGEGQSVAVFMIDIDHFKNFNDRWGHQAGDECLRSVGEALSMIARKHSGLAARFGGEEFVVLLEPLDGANPITLAEEMRSAISHIEIPMREDQETASCTVSIGIAVHGAAGAPDLGMLLSTADRALYNAKRAGRDRCELAA
ncbi:GGDEF domain-containing protein [Qipengyuania aurantiaca]|uniref:diguanylate cyclase n=1 Tax=Qipengyuania aurantiaca TaxID=2867233 RepID=A0ABX8ZTW8_9SPHN|nr:GGDEF domain-containing protein [Qipengyuania aurantiaca]QZD91027.1 GGDEF domain-containing protein [Qipengyuania aurantiaca]